MAAPTLQAEGALNVVTTGDNSPTIPTHQADDIIIVAAGIWAPNTALSINLWSTSDTITNYTLIADLGNPATRDGVIGWWWRRAPSAGTTVTITRPLDAGDLAIDTGTDTAFGARAYVIRGAETTGNPWDAVGTSLARTLANQLCVGVTVSGTERMVVQFLVKTDNYATAPTISGWTAGTQVESATGTDHSQGSFRQDNVSASTTSDASTVEAPAAGFYGFCGMSFKPTTGGGGAAPLDPMGMSGFFGQMRRLANGLLVPRRTIFVPRPS